MTRIGRYELGRLLGEGGGGAVYEATLYGPAGFTKAVAVKVLHRGEESLRREARLAGLLRHRHLVDVYEVGEAEGQWFCAMELCRGGTLSAYTPLPPRAVVEVGLQVCRALAYAHEELGLVHLDLKPDNLLLSEHGEVKVADLGISRARGFADDGRIRGTPGFMPPEQAQGLAVDARADVYALGVTLVELANPGRFSGSGTLDFDFDEARSITLELADTLDLESMEETLDLPVLTTPEIPDWIAPVVSRCLESHPDDRWPDMRALSGALEAVLRTLEGDSLALSLGLTQRAPVAKVRLDHNLEDVGDPFVGRQTELVELARRLETPGLLTLQGTGGIGKSRLARVAAGEWQRAHDGQGWWVDLSAAHSLAGLHHAIAAVLDVPLGSGDLTVQLGHVLAGRGPMVLVLDNFERLLEHAGVLAAWVRHAPQCRMVVTSRVALGVSDEAVFVVRPLELSDARDLLVRRAALRGVEIEADPDLDALAARLDGLPLAIELAAGRLGVLTSADVLARLGSGVLRSGDEGRHATLQAALQWSWDLLSPAQQSALAQLTVFDGGCTVEAAEMVLELPREASVTDAIGGLASHALLRLERGRLTLLVSVRAFAEKQGPQTAAQRRHGAFFAQMGSQQAIEELSLHGGTARRVALSAELDNLVVACRRAIQADEGALAMPLVCGAWAVLELIGPYREAVVLAEAVLAMPSLRRAPASVLSVAAKAHQRVGEISEASRLVQAQLAACERDGDRLGAARARRMIGVLLAIKGSVEEAEVEFRAALAVHRALGDRRGEGWALGDLGNLVVDLGRHAEARDCYEQVLEISRELGDRLGEAMALNNLGMLHRLAGRMEEARRDFEFCLAIHRELGDLRGEGKVINNLGILHHILGNVSHTRSLYESYLEISRQLGDRRGQGRALGNLGLLLQLQGQLDRARTCAVAALEISRELGDRQGEAIALTNVGRLTEDCGDREGARRLLGEARDLAQQLGFSRLQGHCAGEFARLMGGAEALPWVEAGEAILRQAEDPSLLAQLLASKAEVLHGVGQAVAALAALDEAVAVASERDGEASRAIARARSVLELTGAHPG